MTTLTQHIRLLWREPKLRYLVVAGSTSLGYLGLVALGVHVLHLHYMVAILVAQVITIALAFPSYRTYVFESEGPLLRDFVRFLSVWVGGAVAGLVLTPFLVEILHFAPVLAQAIAMVLVAVASYLAHRFFTFRR